MSRPPDRLPRFTPAERWVHRTTGVLVLILFLTAAALYFPALAVTVGRRSTMAAIHVVAGLLLPIPTLLGLLSPEFRADLRRLNRFLPSDWAWLRRRDRRTARLPVGKFNAGQKLAAACVGGAGLVLFGSGLVLLGPARVDIPVGWRQGGTLVHEFVSFALLVLLVGHIVIAYRHPEARAAMRTGRVAVPYARAQHPAWVRELRQEPVDGTGAS